MSSKAALRLWPTRLLIGLATLTNFSFAAEEQLPRRLVVHKEPNQRGETPVAIPVEAKWLPNQYLLERESDGHKRAALIQREGSENTLFAVLDRIPADQDDVYRIRVRTLGEDLPPGVELSESNPRGSTRAWSVLVDGKPFTELRIEAPNPILWPLKGPTGAPFTRAYPMAKIEGEELDHPHHRSLWFTHGAVNGIDFWAVGKGRGEIRNRELRTQSGSNCVATLRMANDWVGPNGANILEEDRVLTIFATRVTRTLDFAITLKATEQPVTFGDTKEGTFGIRVASSMDVKRKAGGKIVNAEGLTDTNAWGKASPWVDYTGPVEGQTVGIAILNHPSSFRFPTTWHVRDYGLFAANPFGYRDFQFGKPGEHTIPEGQSITLRYRVILHRGTTSEADIPGAFAHYAQPPKVELQAD
jgi:hypothetical protein